MGERTETTYYSITYLDSRDSVLNKTGAFFGNDYIPGYDIIKLQFYPVCQTADSRFILVFALK
jgi:hypothetical protein